jgi:hypothetical protein
MYTLRIPSAEFATAALKASAKAGYLGAIFLVARRLDPNVEAELRGWWVDLNDITGKELLILLTGLKTAGIHNHIEINKLAAGVFADGMGITRSHRPGFTEQFEELLSVAKPVPDAPHQDPFVERLIAPEGITNIRQALEISERQLPALLIRSNEDDLEYLICLGNGKNTFSPALLISEIVKQLDDIPHKTKILENKLAGLGTESSHVRAPLIERERSEIQAQLVALAPHRRAILCNAVEITLNQLGFHQEAENLNLVKRRTFSMQTAKSAGKVSDPGMQGRFDLFLSHNSLDKPTVLRLAQKLRKMGLKIWLDESELPPGHYWMPLLEKGIRNSRAMAVIIGQDGIGTWENEEMQMAIMLAVKLRQPVMAVLLPGAPSAEDLPAYLTIRTWVDMRAGLTNECCDRIKFGIHAKQDVAI